MPRATTIVAVFQGRNVTYQGISYACYPLGIMGERTDVAVIRAIARKLRLPKPTAADIRAALAAAPG